MPMRLNLHITLFLSIFLISQSSYSQGSVASVIPSAASKSSSITMIIRGSATNFTKNATSVTFSGNGITVNNVVVNTPEQLTCQVNVSGTADEGAHDITIKVINQPDITEMGAFNVFSSSNALPNVTLVAFPYQSISVSDFDQNRLSQSPLLFNVTVFSGDDPFTKVTAKFTLSSDLYGDISTAEKKLGDLKKGDAPRMFNNREFDTYKVNESQKEFINKALKTGSLPAGTYTYAIQLFDGQGKPIGDKITAINVISNQVTRPDLISPGTPLTQSPETQRNKLPLFQWFSQGGNFDIALYPVNAGQTTPEEISINRPIFIVRGHTSTSFVYPSNGELLEEGKVYAWQVKLNTNNSGGGAQLPSDMFWFRYSASAAPTLAVSELRITPDNYEMVAKSSALFTASGFSANNEPIPNIKVQWSVAPADMGKIDATGHFTSSGKVGSLAIIAKCEDVKEYATVTVINNVATGASKGDLDKFIQQLFGLPKK
jgi:hypothetical protein